MEKKQSYALTALTVVFATFILMYLELGIYEMIAGEEGHVGYGIITVFVEFGTLVLGIILTIASFETIANADKNSEGYFADLFTNISRW